MAVVKCEKRRGYATLGGIAAHLENLMFDVDDMFKRADENRAEMKREFERRAADCPETPIPGDKVVLHAGLLNRGHMWERIEGECIAVAENSVKVRYKKSYDKEMNEEWVHPALITDILKAPVAAE